MGEITPSDNNTVCLNTTHDNRPVESPPPVPDIRRYRPGIVFLATVILLACTASYIVRWADARFFPDPAESRVVCRAPGGVIDIMPRGTTVGAALDRWGVEDTRIDNKTLKRTVPDGSRIDVTETRHGNRVIIEDMPPAERYALGLDFDINRASAPDITLIPGIGEASAARIVAYRKAHGDLLAETDLLAVPGLGRDRARTIARYVTFGPKLWGNPELPDTIEGERPARPSDKLTEDDPPVDINRATADDLMRIPGVGEVTAGRIIKTRDKDGPFRTVADLERVKGIGKMKAEKIGGYVRF
jgi:competence protein ComEA